MSTLEIILAVICGVLAIVAIALPVIMFKKGYENRKKKAEAEIGSAEEEAKRIMNDALKTAEAKKKEAVLEGKDEAHRLRTEADKDIRDRRAEVQRTERNLQQREDRLDRRSEQLEKKEEILNNKIKEQEAKIAETEEIKKGQLAMLEKISQMTVEQARTCMLDSLRGDLERENAAIIRDYEARLKEEEDRKARELISLAIQRVAADHVSESTISVVPIPNDELKGRIIGREGRNVRTLETLTGVDLIIDDTPEAITVSSFDPVRREVARLALERLVLDGRIHPTRIEETVEKARKDVEATIKQEGEAAVIEAGIHGIHPELVKLIGRLKYRTSYGQNVYNHSLEVSHLAGIMASELGVDPVIARRAGLLHDIGKALDHEIEGSHIEIGVDYAKRYKESPEVIHAIHAHHGDVECKTVIACLVQAADAISAARPGARRENLENYIKRLEKLEGIANEYAGVEKSYAVQAGREIRIMVKPDAVNDDKMTVVAREIAKRIEAEMEYPGQIKVNVIRESRAVDYAK